MMEPQKFHDAFYRRAGALYGKGKGAAAIDGKTAGRGREEAGNIKPVHTASGRAVESSLMPGRLCVDEKTNGIKTIPEMQKVIKQIDCRDCIVTADAVNTQKETARAVIKDAHGDRCPESII